MLSTSSLSRFSIQLIFDFETTQNLINLFFSLFTELISSCIFVFSCLSFASDFWVFSIDNFSFSVLSFVDRLISSLEELSTASSNLSRGVFGIFGFSFSFSLSQTLSIALETKAI